MLITLPYINRISIASDGPLSLAQLEYNLPPLKGETLTQQNFAEIVELLVGLGVVQQVKVTSKDERKEDSAEEQQQPPQPVPPTPQVPLFCVNHGIPRVHVSTPTTILHDISQAQAEWRASQERYEILQQALLSDDCNIRHLIQRLVHDEYPETLIHDPVYVAALKNLGVDVVTGGDLVVVSPASAATSSSSKTTKLKQQTTLQPPKRKRKRTPKKAATTEKRRGPARTMHTSRWPVKVAPAAATAPATSTATSAEATTTTTTVNNNNQPSQANNEVAVKNESSESKSSGGATNTTMTAAPTTKELAATPVVEKKTLPNEGVKVAVKDDASSTVPIQRTPNTGVPQPQQPKKNEPVKQFINVQEEEDDGSNDAMETTMTE